MDKHAIELSQLARILFDKAALLWQCSIIFSFLSGLIGVCVSLVGPSLATNVVFAGISAFFLIVGYFLRFRFEIIQDNAETMRRQSVLSEGLGWPIAGSQFKEWRLRAGGKVLSQLAAEPRPDDYYETKSAVGAQRLASMTLESVFWTKSLYRKVQGYISISLVFSSIMFMSMLLIMPIIDLSISTRLYIIYFIYLTVPLLLSVDLLGIFFRLSRGISAFQDIERSLEAIVKAQSTDQGEVLRIVSEYNCVLAAGLPIPKWIFDRHRDEIESCWRI